MTTVICNLSMIPDLVWAAIAASVVTLTGVSLTNRHHSKQQRAQLAHEKEQNEANRKFELRQSVYLDAVEELTLAFQYLGDLASIDLAKHNAADNLTGFFVAATKASLVASDGTAKAINELQEAFARVFFSLLAKISPIQDARIERDIQDNAYEKHWAEVERISASRTQFIEDAMTDTNIWNALESGHKFNLAQAELAAEARSTAWDELNNLKIEFTRQVLTDLKDVAKYSVPALVAIRSELGIPSDIDAYYSDFEGRYIRMKVMINDLIAKLETEAG